MIKNQTGTDQKLQQSQSSIDLENEIFAKLNGSGLSVSYLCGWLRKERGIAMPLDLLRDLVKRNLIVYDHDTQGILILKKK